jgi:D-alanine-D-alanine ligase
VLLYTDEGRDARYSAGIIRAAAERADRVLVLRPGNVGDSVITRRRGHRKYRFRVEANARPPARASRKPEPLRWTWNQLEALARLSSRKERVSVSTLELRTEALPMNLPHRLRATVLLTYPSARIADAMEGKMRETVARGGPQWELKVVSDRPAMPERRGGRDLARALKHTGQRWSIPVERESSVWPSVAGLVPPKVPCLCGVGPVARELGTPHESVQRISLVQRTLLLAGYLVDPS